jgi:predicted DNA-binding transcriptional regulator YafY
LDRITGIQEIAKKYIPNKSIDFNEYFEDIIGVTLNNDGNVENIVMKVSNELLPYIKTKPIHGSQKLKEQGATHSLISIDLIPNYELESLILSYGEGLEIIKPEELRVKLNKRITKMLSLYKK